MDVGVKAARVKSILSDSVFQEILADVKADQVNIFLAPGSSEHQISEARLLIRAMDDLTDRMQRTLHDAQMADRKNKKRP